MSWTFLYRSSDCFSSSILRSCRGKDKLNHSEANLQKESWINYCSSNHKLVKCTFSSLAAINDSTAFFILCTSTSSEQRKVIRQRTVVFMFGMDSKPEHTRSNWRIYFIQTTQAAMLLTVITVTSQPQSLFCKRPSNRDLMSLCAQVFHFGRTFSLFRTHTASRFCEQATLNITSPWDFISKKFKINVHQFSHFVFPMKNPHVVRIVRMSPNKCNNINICATLGRTSDGRSVFL